MAENAATEILDALMRNLREILRTESIIGQPIQAGNTTILPVIKVFVGFGAGGGSAGSEKGAGSPGGDRPSLVPTGGGGGGGMAITPVGFLVIEDGRAMMITPGAARWDWIVDSIPDLWEKISKVRYESHERKAGRGSAAKNAAGGTSSTPPDPDTSAH